ncbi:hypothetical protein BCR37DRAFT_395290 [Protomyces lactucae-debilis]|uniref:Uncharacterized protein n=1 Tax=Protomyces lactucae-debilis TaxID=2754530 RepID=A0A1Y2F056_PROLT|nr:uncharacterized protein BCR37DRAFT_395290 [Protomyces lactucae-debilis]ORY76355.1 hypothetical protein BCR37DRAFT_395290 [Protomyces lactucae-debilis]
MFEQSTNTLFVLAQTFAFLQMHFVFFTGLVNTAAGISIDPANSCTAYWLELAIDLPAYSWCKNCAYNLHSGSGNEIPATSNHKDAGDIEHHGDYNACYYVAIDDRCHQTDHESYFQERVADDKGKFGIFCQSKSLQKHPSLLPMNAFLSLGRQVHWNLKTPKDGICQVQYADIPPEPAYWLAYGKDRKLTDDTCPFVLQTQQGINDRNKQSGILYGYDRDDSVFETPWTIESYEPCYFILPPAVPHASCPNSGNYVDDFFQVTLNDVAGEVEIVCPQVNDNRTYREPVATHFRPSWRINMFTGSWEFEAADI